MTTAQLIFDPFSEAHYDDPYETYRRLRDEAPVYYSEQYDFYAPSRHADVAAAFKDFATYSSARGVTLEEIQDGNHEHDQSIIWMDPPAHRRMRSLVNKVITPRAITAQDAVVRERIEHYLSVVDPVGSTWWPNSRRCFRSRSSRPCSACSRSIDRTCGSGKTSR